LLIAQLEEELSATEAIYFAWVTGTTVGYGDLLPTSGTTRFLAIIIAVLGIVLTGIVVAIAIEAAKVAIENNTSIQEFKQAIKESTQQRIARNKRRPSIENEEKR
jgi:hypothetical protein